jgi:hypothetical protein
MVNLGKILHLKFPQNLSKIVRELYARMGSLDPFVVHQLANWQAYHLMHYDLEWPWEKWSYAIQNAENYAKRNYCALVIKNLANLVPYDKLYESIDLRYKVS